MVLLKRSTTNQCFKNRWISRIFRNYRLPLKTSRDDFTKYHPKLTGVKADVIRGLVHSNNSAERNGADTCYVNKGEGIWNADHGTSFKYLDDEEKEIYYSYKVIKQSQASIQEELKQVADEKKRILSNWQKHRDALAEKHKNIANLKQEAGQMLESMEKNRNTLDNRLVRNRKLQAKMLQINLCIRQIQMSICKDKIQIFDRNIVDMGHPLMVGVVKKQNHLASLKAELIDHTQFQRVTKETQSKLAKQLKIQERLYQFLCCRLQQAEHNIQGLKEFMNELEQYINQLKSRFDSLTLESTSIAIKRLAFKEKLQNIYTSRKLKLLGLDL